MSGTRPFWCMHGPIKRRFHWLWSSTPKEGPKFRFSILLRPASVFIEEVREEKKSGRFRVWASEPDEV